MLATFPFFVLLAPLLFLTFLRISLFAAFPHLSHLSLAISGRTHIPFTTSIATSIMPWPSRPRLNCAVTATSCASLRLVFVATAPYRYSGVTHARRGGVSLSVASLKVPARSRREHCQFHYRLLYSYSPLVFPTPLDGCPLLRVSLSFSPLAPLLYVEVRRGPIWRER